MQSKHSFPGKYLPCQHDGYCGCASIHSYEAQYRKIFTTLNISSVLEWGPGLNTEIAIENGSRVFSKEHDGKWIPTNISSTLWSHGLYDVGTPDYIEVMSGEWDLYFVDGRRRSECLESVFKCCKESALVCLHDAQRPRYHDALSLFKKVFYVDPGFAVATKSEELGALIEAF